MELFILIITLCILAESTVLVLKTRQKPFITTNQKRKLYVDTSALMDPRLLAVAQTGFIGDDLIIPRSVIHELQLLADGKDHDKRLRARAGLDTVRELERVVFFNLTILDDALDRTLVDNRLLELAKANHGLILTNDFNLKKVAATEHIDALNLNELALVLRNEYLPGERVKVKIISTGSGIDQGVAYLKDGTMVVVDHASKRVGEEIEVEFLRLNQTASGTMMFARPVASPKRSELQPKRLEPQKRSEAQAKVKRAELATKKPVRSESPAPTSRSSRRTATAKTSKPAARKSR